MVSLRRPQAYATHIEHPIDTTANTASLRRNAQYFARKFPEIVRTRAPYWQSLGAYELAYRGHTGRVPELALSQL